MKNQEHLISQAKAVVQLGEKVLATETTSTPLKGSINEQQFHDFRITALSYFSRVFGKNSTYHQSFLAEVTQPTASRTRRGIGMLTAALGELQGDWLETTRGSISRDILTDFLRLATLQLETGNHHAAVILAGAILNKVLRDICMAHGVTLHNQLQDKAVPKKGLQLAGEAYKKKLIDRKQHKNIIEWLEFSEGAAVYNNETASISANKAKAMLTGVQNFIGKSKY